MVPPKQETNEGVLHTYNKFDSLPTEVFDRCLSFLDMRDLCFGVECVCRSIRDSSRKSCVWKVIALRKYGAEIVAEAVSNGVCYVSFKHMVADDMRLVAQPTISMVNSPVSCQITYESYDEFSVCLVFGIKYHRPADEIRIYIEVRGEEDLSHPSACCIAPIDKYGVAILRNDSEWVKKTKGFEGISYGRGHYQGYVSFEASFFDRPGSYMLCYYDPTNGTRFTGTFALNISPSDGSVENTFRNYISYRKINNKILYTLENWSPFFMDGDDDSKELAELERFRPFVDPLVWNRHNRPANYPKWWTSSFTGDSEIYTSFVDSLGSEDELWDAYY